MFSTQSRRSAAVLLILAAFFAAGPQEDSQARRVPAYKVVVSSSPTYCQPEYLGQPFESESTCHFDGYECGGNGYWCNYGE